MSYNGERKCLCVIFCLLFIENGCARVRMHTKLSWHV